MNYGLVAGVGLLYSKSNGRLHIYDTIRQANEALRSIDLEDFPDVRVVEIKVLLA